MSESKTCDRDAVRKLLDDPAAASGFRAELRRAREACQRDSEAFDEILFSLERLGCFLHGKAIGLGAYKCCLCRLVSVSSICLGGVNFEELLQSVIDARNDALHQGAVARHLANRSIEVALILEKALGRRLKKIDHRMVKQPVVAESWHTLAMIRQTMLANAFSYLPYKNGEKWFWISDHALAAYLHREERNEALAKPLVEAVDAEWTEVKDVLAKDDEIQRALDLIVASKGIPLLVLEREQLIGIITAADLL